MSAIQMKAMLHKALDEFAVTCEFYKLDAKLKREQYLALIKEGFSESQAIDLIRPRS